MQGKDEFYQLPTDLPAPVDDGACAHLPGMRVPSLSLLATGGSAVDLSALRGRTVVFCYPRTGEPGRPVPPGWDDVPGARGCTPQACAFRDHHAEIEALVARVFGLSTQTSGYQREVVNRLHLLFPLLSDADLTFTRALHLPTFEFDGMTLTRRLTLIVENGSITDVMYPVFPPDRNAEEVIERLKMKPIPTAPGIGNSDSRVEYAR